jgi:hypothetical protein
MVPVPTSYIPSYGSGSGFGSLHNFEKNVKHKISFTQISIETVWKQVDFNLELFIFFFSSSVSFQTNLSNPYLRPFLYTEPVKETRPGTGTYSTITVSVTVLTVEK